jgi:hypothetical protein
MADAAQQWRRSIQVVEADAPYLERLLWIRCEDGVNRPTETLSSIAKFLGLTPFLESYLPPESVSIHERNQSVTDLNAESIARLTEGDSNTFNAIAADCFRRFDYPVLTS